MTEVARIVHHLDDAEVDDLRHGLGATAREEDVLGLDVSMNDSFALCAGEAFEHVFDDGERVVDVEVTTRAKQLSQVAAVELSITKKGIRSPSA